MAISVMGGSFRSVDGGSGITKAATSVGWSRPRGSGLGVRALAGERGPAQAPSDPGGAEGIAMRYACAFMEAG